LDKKRINIWSYKKREKFISPSTKLYLRDVLDRINLGLSKVDILRPALYEIHKTYLGKVTIEMGIVADETNNIVKRFSSVSILLLFYTTIAGIMGMNVPVPFQNNVLYRGYAPFIIINASFVLFTIVAIIILRKIKWL